MKKEQYILVDENGYITLTDKGLQKAKSVFEKHQHLTNFLIQTANVSKSIAEEDACRMEHIISEETFAGIKKFLGVE